MKWIITGGAGFIGCNTAQLLLKNQDSLILVDNLSRAGTRQNLEWLSTQGNFEFIQGDIRNFDLLKDIFRKHSDIHVVLHLAAQTAVTSSVTNPREDFEINLLGTFNLCEALRLFSPRTFLLNASSNKVYGKMEELGIVEKNGRYAYQNLPNGIAEKQPLDFHSPYGCSKGGAEQYVRDYGRIYGLKTVSFRQSCIYGTRQFGIEDQGWVAWFMIAATTRRPLTIYGDGKQVRDILWVEDLIECYRLSVKHMDQAAGQIYNIGGGPQNTSSLLELIAFIEESSGRKVEYSFQNWRPGDQPVYVSEITKAEKELGWRPKTSKSTGLSSLFHWVEKEKHLFTDLVYR